MTKGFKTKGNINYGFKDSQALVEEIYNYLKGIEEISINIPNLVHDPKQDSDTNMQDIEKEIDNYIEKDNKIKKAIIDIFEKRNIIIPHQRATEKNEVIDAKKKIIREAIS